MATMTLVDSDYEYQIHVYRFEDEDHEWYVVYRWFEDDSPIEFDSLPEVWAWAEEDQWAT